MVNDPFSVLADPTRVLEVTPRRERSPQPPDVTPVMSRHLRILLESGFVADERVLDDACPRFPST